MMLVFVMLFSLTIGVFADNVEAVSDYVEVILDADTQNEYDKLEGFGLPYMHVAFKERIWGLGYYEMGLNASIQNTHGLTSSNIRSIDLGKGLASASIVIPLEGNEEFNPVEVSFKEVKHGYWFPTIHKVMVLTVSKRTNDFKINAPNTHYTHTAMTVEVSGSDAERFTENLDKVELISGNSTVNLSREDLIVENSAIIIPENYFNLPDTYTIKVYSTHYGMGEISNISVVNKQPPTLYTNHLSEEDYTVFLKDNVYLVGNDEGISNYIDHITGVFLGEQSIDYHLKRIDNYYGMELNASYFPEIGSYTAVIKSKGYDDKEVTFSVVDRLEDVQFVYPSTIVKGRELVVTAQNTEGDYLSKVSSIQLNNEEIASYTVDIEKDQIILENNLFQEVGDYQFTVFATGYDPKEIIVTVKEEQESLKVTGIEKVYYNGWIISYDYYIVSFNDENYAGNINEVVVGETTYGLGSSYSFPYSSYYVENNQLYLRRDRGFYDDKNTVVQLTADGYDKFSFEVTKDHKLVTPEPGEDLPAPVLTTKEDYIRGENVVLSGNYSNYFNHITEVLCGDESLTYYYDNNNLILKAENFTEEKMYTILIKADGYENSTYAITVIKANSVELPNLNAKDTIYIGNSLVVQDQNGKSTFFSTLEKIEMTKNDEIVELPNTSYILNEKNELTLKGGLFNLPSVYTITFYSKGYMPSTITVDVLDYNIPPSVTKIERKYQSSLWGGYYYYEVAFEDDYSYLDKVESIDFNNTNYTSKNEFGVDKNQGLLYLYLDDLEGYVNEGMNYVTVHAASYEPLLLAIKASHDENGPNKLMPPTVRKVGLRAVLNPDMPFAGSVRFLGDKEDIDTYLNAIDEIYVSGLEYTKFDVKKVVTEFLGIENSEGSLLLILLFNISTIQEFVENTDFSVQYVLSQIVELSSSKHSYYLMPDMPSAEAITGIFTDLKDLAVLFAEMGLSEEGIDYEKLALDIKEEIKKVAIRLGIDSFFDWIIGSGDTPGEEEEESDERTIPSIIADLFEKVYHLFKDSKSTNIYLTADGFNLPLNTPVKIVADGYEDLTFTFDGVGNIVSQGDSKEPLKIKEYTFDEDMICEYVRLSFDGSEYEAADYIAKITNIKVNGAYYKKHSSLIFNKAYMLSKVYGDVFGYYVFVDMTVDGFTEGKNTIEIIAEGYDNLIFTIEK